MQGSYPMDWICIIHKFSSFHWWRHRALSPSSRMSTWWTWPEQGSRTSPPASSFRWTCRLSSSSTRWSCSQRIWWWQKAPVQIPLPQLPLRSVWSWTSMTPVQTSPLRSSSESSGQCHGLSNTAPWVWLERWVNWTQCDRSSTWFCSGRQPAPLFPQSYWYLGSYW